MSKGEKVRGLRVMGALAVVVGAAAGLGAYAFRLLIALIHNLFFLGKFSADYNVNQHTAFSPWGIGIILVPVVGAFGVAWLVKKFAPEARGHGVPEVMYAIHWCQGRIRPVVALVKALASALSIGSGASVGREGPIIQIGAALGSTLGQLIRLPARQRITLIAAGASAGIAATFNAPLGGIAFSVELLLLSVNATNFFTVALATVTATYFGRVLMGLSPAFDIPALRVYEMHLTEPWALLLFLPFGVLMGLVSLLFIRSIYWAEDGFRKLTANYYVRHAIGMALLGALIYLMYLFRGHYYVQGVGYATIADILRNTLSDPVFLLCLFAIKLVATSITLGSGASGGIFSPSMFMGAALGAAFGQVVLLVFPWIGIGPEVFAIAGLAAAVSGATGAVITAIIMTFEMSLDYNAILPIILSAATAFAVRRTIAQESIYTLKLLRRGQVVPQGLQAAVDASRQVGHVMMSKFQILTRGEKMSHYDGVTVITSKSKIIGFVHPLPSGISSGIKAELLLSDSFIVVRPGDGLVATLRALRETGAELALVSKDPSSNRADELVGVLTEHQIAEATKQTADLL